MVRVSYCFVFVVLPTYIVHIVTTCTDQHTIYFKLLNFEVTSGNCDGGTRNLECDLWFRTRFIDVRNFTDEILFYNGDNINVYPALDIEDVSHSWVYESNSEYLTIMIQFINDDDSTEHYVVERHNRIQNMMALFKLRQVWYPKVYKIGCIWEAAHKFKARDQRHNVTGMVNVFNLIYRGYRNAANGVVIIYSFYLEIRRNDCKQVSVVPPPVQTTEANNCEVTKHGAVDPNIVVVMTFISITTVCVVGLILWRHTTVTCCQRFQRSANNPTPPANVEAHPGLTEDLNLESQSQATASHTIRSIPRLPAIGHNATKLFSPTSESVSISLPINFLVRESSSADDQEATLPHQPEAKLTKNVFKRIETNQAVQCP